jgi:hypothetical protein
LQASPSVGLQAPATRRQDVRFIAWEDGGLLLWVSGDPNGEVLTGPETVAHTAGCGCKQPRADCDRSAVWALLRALRDVFEWATVS